MWKLFKKSSKQEKFKKLEHQIKKGLWPFVLKTAFYWGLYMALANFLISYLMGPPVTTQKIAVTLFVNCIFGIPLGFLWWAQLKKSYANLRKSLKLDVWGTGIFDDGAACDVINTVIHKDQSIDVLIRKALSTLNNDTIECTQGYEVIVASAMSSAILNKTSYSEIDDLDTWLSKQDTASVLHHKADLVNALKRILSDQSDLNEIWSENADDYPVWRSNIEKLVEALDTASS